MFTSQTTSYKTFHHWFCSTNWIVNCLNLPIRCWPPNYKSAASALSCVFPSVFSEDNNTENFKTFLIMTIIELDENNLWFQLVKRIFLLKLKNDIGETGEDCSLVAIWIFPWILPTLKCYSHHWIFHWIYLLTNQNVKKIPTLCTLDQNPPQSTNFKATLTAYYSS